MAPIQELDSRYFYYVLLASSPFLRTLGQGATFTELGGRDLAEFTVPVPPLAEQRAIANFLDAKTEKIDELVEQKEELSRLLVNRLQALIDHEVMGADSTSGLPVGGWPPAVPPAWQTVKLKYLAKAGRRSFTDGDWVESPYITDDGIRLIQTGNIGHGSYREQGFRYVSEESFRALHCTEVHPGDILICRLADPVGRACLAPDLGCRMITAVDVAILKAAAEHNPRFLVYALSSSRYLAYVEAICRGGTRDRISRSMLGNIKIPIPPRSEQDAIVDRLDEASDATKATVRALNQQTSKLQEYRRSLIARVVSRGLGDTDGPEGVA